MFEHLRYRSARVEARGPAGNKAEEILLLNDEESVSYREFLLGLIKLTEDRKYELEQTIRSIDDQLMAGTGNRQQLDTEKQAAQSELAKVFEYLTRLGAAE